MKGNLIILKVQCSLFIKELNCVISNYFVKFHGKKNWEPQPRGHNMTMLYPTCVIMRCVIKGMHCILVTNDLERNNDLRHGLIDGFYSVSHCKLINNFLRWFIKVHLPRFILK